MKVGILKEIKVLEKKVCMVPSGVATMTASGHEVTVETMAGAAVGFADADYIACGASIAATPAEMYGACDMVMHVEEPQPSEYEMIREGQIVFSHLHLAADPKQTEALIKAKSINIACESIARADGSRPLLIPVHEVTGRLAVLAGAEYLQTPQGGMGVLLGDVTGVAPVTVVIFGGGVVGSNAAKTAAALGAQVYLLDTDLDRLKYLSGLMPANAFPLLSHPSTIKKYLAKADLVIGAELPPEGKNPMLLTRDMLKDMKQGSVIVDAVIDRGGCFETSRPTSLTEPTYVVDGVVHYCVADMAGTAVKTSTLALTSVTLPYALEIANKGWKRAGIENREIALGINVACGKITCRGVAEALNIDHTPVDTFLSPLMN